MTHSIYLNRGIVFIVTMNFFEICSKSLVSSLVVTITMLLSEFDHYYVNLVLFIKVQKS